jgi:fructokinase
MITVAGEALMDVLVDVSGSVTASPGGAPFNVARMVARLGAECQFVGRLSDDVFGRQLRASLEHQHVRLVLPTPSPSPTTLAIAQLDDGGSAEYRFYLDGTAAAELEPDEVPAQVIDDSELIVFGGLGLVLQPIASTLIGLLPRVAQHCTVIMDPNCRASAIRDLAAYRATVARCLGAVDIVKVSIDDLRLLAPEESVQRAARSLLDLGPTAVLVTNGPAPVVIHTRGDELSVPVPQVDVVDTVGAGDAFLAGFSTSWSSQSLHGDGAPAPEALASASAAGVEVAVAACSVRGADLPEDFVWSPVAAAKH